jgi:hypothetical protein
VFVVNPRNIFLLDAIGACVSAISLGVILPLLHAWIGMPLHVLYGLCACAVFFALYSFSRYAWADYQNGLWLKIVIALNLTYCLVSAFFLWLYWPQLKTLGTLYFVSEKLVVLGVVGLEWKTLKQISPLLPQSIDENVKS